MTEVNGVSRIQSLSSLCLYCGQNSQLRTYGLAGDVATSKDFKGNIATYEHDTRGLETQRIEASNDTTGNKRTIQTDWHTNFRAPTERRTLNATDTLVAKRTWTYNIRGQALTASQIDPVTSAVRTTTTTYCEQAGITAGTCPLIGLVTSVNGARTDVSDVTTYTYRMAEAVSCASAPTTCAYRKGDLWKVTNALGQVSETLTYDGAGRVLATKDTNGVFTDYEYHPRGWMTARKVRGTNSGSETDDAITRIDYWPTGLVKEVVQPDGAFTAYVYDAAHRLTDILDGDGNQIHYTLDNAGNRLQEDTKDASGTLKRTLSRVYNQLGQLQTQKDADQAPTGFTYDANGNPDTITDALGRETDNNYDPLSRLARTLQDVGGIEAETAFEYDALDQLTEVTDPKGLDTDYTYNGLGDLLQLDSPDTGTTSYTYDSAGNRKTQTDARNKTATYSYDALNRLTGISYPTSSLNISYVYDDNRKFGCQGANFGRGRLTRMIEAIGTTLYCYDRFGHLVDKRQTIDGKVFAVRYAYTRAGQISSVRYPDGATVDYIRDGQSRITEVGITPAGGVRQILLYQASYHPFGPIASWSFGNGRSLIRTLNQNYQPETILDSGAGGLSLRYNFSAVGNLTQLEDGTQVSILAQYDYDTLNRLSDVKDGPTGTVIEHYAYDATGNRQSVFHAGATTAYTYPTTSHRLDSVGAEARNYDAAGNTTQIGGTAREFVYSDTGRMSQVKAGGTVTMNYAYNGRGEQVRKSIGTTNTYTVYDEAGHWMGDYDSSGAVIQQAIWLDDLPVGLLTATGAMYYVEPDHLGTPRVVVDPIRDVVVWNWPLISEAFGKTPPNQDPDNDGTQLVLNMRFPGQRYDAASGLNYNYFRDYSPGDGRYVQSDPIGLNGGISTYGYVAARPLMFSDPFGLEGSGPWWNPGSLHQQGVRHGQAIHGVYEDYRSRRAWGHQRFPGERNSFARHCTVSCILSKKYGTGLTRGTGIVNEYQGFYIHDLWNLPNRFDGSRPWAFQPDDLAANEAGFKCAGSQSCPPAGADESSTVSECEKCCTLGVMYGY